MLEIRQHAPDAIHMSIIFLVAVLTYLEAMVPDMVGCPEASAMPYRYEAGLTSPATKVGKLSFICLGERDHNFIALNVDSHHLAGLTLDPNDCMAAGPEVHAITWQQVWLFGSA